MKREKRKEAEPPINAAKHSNHEEQPDEGLEAPSQQKEVRLSDAPVRKLELREGEMADYCFTPSWNKGGEAFNLVPPLFSKVIKPAEYYFVNKMAKPEALYRDDGDEAAAAGAVTAFGLDFGLDFREAQLPLPPSEEDFAVPSLHERGAWEKGVSVLRRLFDERPIWSRAMIQGHVDATWHHLVRPLLLKIAYTFHNGPWRLLWVKKGVDPRADPSARQYQLLDFRVPRAWYNAMPKGHEDFFQSSVMRPWGGMINGPEDETGEAINGWKATQRFERAPKQRSTFFQLCDLEDDDMQRYLESQPVLDTCDSISGWYPAAALTEVRRMMKERYRKFLPEGNPWRDLATPVAPLSKAHSMWDIEAVRSGWGNGLKRKRVEDSTKKRKEEASKSGEGLREGTGEEATKDTDISMTALLRGDLRADGRSEPAENEEGDVVAVRMQEDDANENSSSGGEEGDEVTENEGDVREEANNEEDDVSEEEDENEDDVSEEEDEYESDVSEEKEPAVTLDRRRVEASPASEIPRDYMQALLGRFPTNVGANDELTHGSSFQEQLESEEAFPIFEPEDESDDEEG